MPELQSHIAKDKNIKFESESHCLPLIYNMTDNLTVKSKKFKFSKFNISLQGHLSTKWKMLDLNLSQSNSH